MRSNAIIMEEPGRVAIASVPLNDPTDDDVVVAVDWSGISSGTERLLWQGRMPDFPGMGYPLVPGYELVGRIVHAGVNAQVSVGDRVFVPGSNCFVSVRALFGGASRRLVAAGSRVMPLDPSIGVEATLLALAATAYHAAPVGSGLRPDLIVGHGVLGRLLARITMLEDGAPPMVWEKAASRRSGGVGYAVIDPADDDCRQYRRICDASGDDGLLDTLIKHLAPGGEIVLAGFYTKSISFNFPPAFMREARLRIAAQFLPSDLIAVRDLVQSGRLSLNGLLTHRSAVEAVERAYRTASDDSDCLKMVLDWRDMS